jgi:AraC family transcriptional regulator
MSSTKQKKPEVIVMSKNGATQVVAPRIEDGRALRIAGFSEHYTGETMRNIPQLWDRLIPHLGSIPGHAGRVAYGLVMAPDEGKAGIKYVAGIDVAPDANVGEFASVSLPAGRYAIFNHDGHVSKLNTTIDQIWREWLPASGYIAAADAKRATIERYGEGFDPKTGSGDIEVWVPIHS